MATTKTNYKTEINLHLVFLSNKIKLQKVNQIEMK